MNAARLYAYGDELVLESVPEPTIDGPHDVIVRVGAAGLCRTDLHIIEGQWAAKANVRLPYILGHETAGWVHAVGSAVEHVAPGDLVIAHPLMTCGLCRACRAGADMHCERQQFPGINTDGGFAELLKTNARATLALERSVNPTEVAALADAGLTAYHAVKRALPKLHPGARAIVIGAGGLGHIGIQCVKALCAAEIIVLDRNEQALELASKCGADHVVLADAKGVGLVRELTEDKGGDVVFDFVGEGSSIPDGMQLIRNGGDYYVIGYGGTVDIPAIEIISREISFVGNLVGTYVDLAELMTLAARGCVKTEITTFPLSAANDAIALLDRGRLVGRGVLVPTEL